MKITFLVIGKTVNSYLKDGFAEYEKRLTRYVSFHYAELSDIKNTKKMPVEVQKEKEGEKIMNKLKNDDVVILLDERGKMFTSTEFSQFIENKMLQSPSSVVFIVGGAYGFSEKVYARADAKLSLSKMTLPHQLIRLVFIEQLYRAFTIMKGEPYHHE